MTFGAIQAMQSSLKHNQRPKKKGFKAWRDKIVKSSPKNKATHSVKKNEAKLKILRNKIARDKRISLIKQAFLLTLIIILVSFGYYLLFFN